MKAKFILIFMILSLFSFSQNPEMNQLDSEGKKHGIWIVWLNKTWKKLNDSINSVNFRYTVYDHGTNLYPMGEVGRKNWKLESQGSSKLLDGEYKWFDEKGTLRAVHVLKNGHYISCKEYYPSGELNQHFDYTKKWQGHENTWVVYVYDKKGQLILESYMKKDNDGKWPKTRG